MHPDPVSTVQHDSHFPLPQPRLRPQMHPSYLTRPLPTLLRSSRPSLPLLPPPSLLQLRFRPTYFPVPWFRAKCRAKIPGIVEMEEDVEGREASDGGVGLGEAGEGAAEGDAAAPPRPALVRVREVDAAARLR